MIRSHYQHILGSNEKLVLLGLVRGVEGFFFRRLRTAPVTQRQAVPVVCADGRISRLSLILSTEYLLYLAHVEALGVKIQCPWIMMDDEGPVVQELKLIFSCIHNFSVSVSLHDASR
jgi:hypothetical protein